MSTNRTHHQDEEVESDEEGNVEMRPAFEEKKNEPRYITQSRVMSKKAKKLKKLANQDATAGESSGDDDEQSSDEEGESGGGVKDYEESDLRRQLRLEREEAERKAQTQKTRVDPDGTEYEWDPDVKGWFPKVPDQQFIQYQQGYQAPTLPTTTAANAASASGAMVKAFDENAYYLFNGGFYKWDKETKNWTPTQDAVYSYIDYMTAIKYDWNQEAKEWQPAKGQIAAATEAANKAAAKPEPAKDKKADDSGGGWFQINEEKNTNVYVSGMPLDITEKEFEEMMSKYGIIAKELQTGKPKLKLYRDDEHNEVKGDGLCCYLMPESVQLCLQLLDGSMYRDHTISVSRAKFEPKSNFDASKKKQGGGGGSSSAAIDAQKRKLNKAKEKKFLERQKQKLLDWEERPEVVRHKHEKVVVIKGLFDPKDAQNDPNFVQRYKDDLKNELEEYGVVKKILIYDKNPEGIATVSFKDVEMADRCCEWMDNRVWRRNGRIIRCETWDGATRFDREETEEEQQKRIEEWHRFIESDE